MSQGQRECTGSCGTLEPSSECALPCSCWKLYKSYCRLVYTLFDASTTSTTSLSPCLLAGHNPCLVRSVFRFLLSWFTEKSKDPQLLHWLPPSPASTIASLPLQQCHHAIIPSVCVSACLSLLPMKRAKAGPLTMDTLPRSHPTGCIGTDPEAPGAMAGCP